MKIINIKNKNKYALNHKILVSGTVARVVYSKDGSRCRFWIVEDGTNNIIRCAGSLKINHFDIAQTGDDVRALVKIKRHKYVKSEKMEIIDAVAVELLRD